MRKLLLACLLLGALAAPALAEDFDDPDNPFRVYDDSIGHPITYQVPLSTTEAKPQAHHRRTKGKKKKGHLLKRQHLAKGGTRAKRHAANHLAAPEKALNKRSKAAKQHLPGLSTSPMLAPVQPPSRQKPVLPPPDRR